VNTLRTVSVVVGCLLGLGCGAGTVASPDLAVAGDLAAPVDAAKADFAGCKLSAPYSSKDAVCNGCAESHCCVEVNACYASTSCNDDYVNCYLGCGLFANPDAGGTDVTACIADCGTMYPAGKVQFEAAIGCVDTSCAGKCK